MSNNNTNADLLNLIRANANPADAMVKAVNIITAFLKLCESTEVQAPACPQAHD